MGIFDERDPLSLHMLGMHGQEPQLDLCRSVPQIFSQDASSLLRAAYANFAIQNADCIIAVGTGLIQPCSDCKALREAKTDSRQPLR